MKESITDCRVHVTGEGLARLDAIPPTLEATAFRRVDGSLRSQQVNHTCLELPKGHLGKVCL
jgi:hypothetical protein